MTQPVARSPRPPLAKPLAKPLAAPLAVPLLAGFVATWLVACTSPLPTFDDGGPGVDAGVMDGGSDAGFDAGFDAGDDAGEDAGQDAGPTDAGPFDAGPFDAGPCPVGFDECDGDPTVFCETDITQDATCGSCDNVCPSYRSCDAMACAPPGIAQIEAGSDHVCALLDDGRVFCWGRDHRGQLGDGSTPEDSSDDRPNAEAVVDLSGIRSIHLGASAACAIDGTGVGRCFGNNNPERFGNGTHSGTQPRPVDMVFASVPGPLLQIDHDNTHLCARTASAVYCAGRNTLHQLGRETAATPILDRLLGLPFERVPRTIAVGYSGSQGFTLVADDDGDVWCVGANDDSECGQPSSSEVAAPVAIAGLSDIVQVDAGFEFACALDDAGAVFCWGSNSSGRLGNGTVGGPDVATPTQVMGIPAMRSISVGGGNVLAVTMDGSAVWAWGANSSGSLGLGPAASGPQPTPMPAIVDSGSVFEATTVFSHSCVLQRRAGMRDTVLCAGSNSGFRLGMDPAPTPTAFTALADFP